MIRYYMDHHIDMAITEALRAEGIDVLTALEDGMSRRPDSELLQRASLLERVLFTQDTDFLHLVSLWQKDKMHFSGVLFVSHSYYALGLCIRTLQLIGMAGEPEDFANKLVHLQEYY